MAIKKTKIYSIFGVASLAISLFVRWYLGNFLYSLLQYELDEKLHIYKEAEWIASYASIIIVMIGTFALLWCAYKLGTYERMPKAPPQLNPATAASDVLYEVKRDVWLSAAIWRAFSGKWELASGELAEIVGGRAQQFSDTVDKIRQFAFDGNLPIWGKGPGDSLWKLIPAEFWGKYEINYLMWTPDPYQLDIIPIKKELDVAKAWREFMTSRAAIDRLFPKASGLHLSVGEVGSYFKTTGRGLWASTRIFNLKVHNANSQEPIKSIKVSLLSTIPTERQGPWIIKEGFDLAAGEDIFIPLVQFGEASQAQYSSTGFDRANSFAEVLGERFAPTLDKHVPHVLSIRATGLGSGPCDFKCKVWVESPNGRFHIDEILDA